jgi:hypothetical protein
LYFVYHLIFYRAGYSRLSPLIISAAFFVLQQARLAIFYGKASRIRVPRAGIFGERSVAIATREAAVSGAGRSRGCTHRACVSKSEALVKIDGVRAKSA